MVSTKHALFIFVGFVVMVSITFAVDFGLAFGFIAEFSSFETNTSFDASTFLKFDGNRDTAFSGTLEPEKVCLLWFCFLWMYSGVSIIFILLFNGST